MTSVRIVKRTSVDNSVEFIVQQKHFLFRFWWVDAWINSIHGALCKDYFDTFEEAKNNLCYFDGSACEDEIVFTKPL